MSSNRYISYISNVFISLINLCFIAQVTWFFELVSSVGYSCFVIIHVVTKFSLHQSGNKVFLVTNSDYRYTEV